MCNGIAGEVMLSEMPQLRDVFDASYAALDEMASFTAGVESRLNECLRSNTIPDDDLVDAIAVAKIRCIDVALERAHALRKEVQRAACTLSHALANIVQPCMHAPQAACAAGTPLTPPRLWHGRWARTR